MKYLKGSYRLLAILFIVNSALLLITNSYIHPDEQYQSLEPLIKYLNNDFIDNPNGSITWEYILSEDGVNKPIRSISILYMYYGMILKILLYLYSNLDKINILNIISLLKLYNLSIFTIIFVKFNNLFNKNNSFNINKSILFMFTSYTLLTYQVRFFSNSIETLLLMLTLISMQTENYLFMSVLIAFGIHNRITFITWLIIPALKLLYKEVIVKKNYKNILVKIPISMILTSYLIFKTDSSIYSIENETFYTPLENILYNKNSENLSKHGTHSRFTHLFINNPVLIGPLLLMIIKYKHNLIKSKQSLPILSAISGILFHSLIPHQEARFLIPAIPLLIVSCNYSSIDLKKTKSITKLVFLANIIFNIVMLILMGSLHQSGLLTLMKNKKNLSLIENHDIGYWHTLMPLHWPYYITLNETERNQLYINFVSDETDPITGFREFDTSLRKINLENQKYNIYDFMGIDSDNLDHLLTQLKTENTINQMYLILPYSFIQTLSSFTQSYEIIEHNPYHLNLNDGIDTWPFGLYSVSYTHLTLPTKA